jgi:CDI immunity proteins
MEQTLEQLENSIWGEPEYGSHLVVTCNRLRKKPIDQFTVEDFRIMLGQDIGTEYLMPKALNILEVNPLADGDFYAGDLLESLMRLPEQYWKEHPENLNRARKVVSNALDILNSRAPEDIYPSDEDLFKETNQFLAKKFT